MVVGRRGGGARRPPDHHAGVTWGRRDRHPMRVPSVLVTTAPDGFAPHSTAVDRTIEFRRVFNVRDLGGLRTVDGRAVRRGCVYRGDGVQRLRDDDLEAEPVKHFETSSQDSFCASSSSGLGLLIHAALGSGGETGGLLTKRSGWAA